MSIKIGGSKSKYSNTTTTNSTSTTTPVTPDWIAHPVQQAAGQVTALGAADPYGFVAPATGLQQMAANSAAGLTGQGWNYDTAAALTRGASDTSWLTPYVNRQTPTITGAQASDYLSSYLNPYLHEVADSTAADLDAHDGQVRAQQALDLAGAGAFGGSGAAITQSMTEGELARARASALSNLRSQGYATALAAAGADADRANQAKIAAAQTALQDQAQKAGLTLQGQQQQLAAGNQLANIASGLEANQRADIATQAAVGGTFRDIDQQRAQAPVTNAQQVVAMLNGLPFNLFAGQQTVGNSTTEGSGKSTNLSVEASHDFRPNK